jgi:hypothetical protein
MAGIPRSQGRAQPKIGPSDSSDSVSDRPNQSTDTDAGGTGERATVGRAKPPRPETSTDRVAEDREVGLGGGLIAGCDRERQHNQDHRSHKVSDSSHLDTLP